MKKILCSLLLLSITLATVSCSGPSTSFSTGPEEVKVEAPNDDSFVVIKRTKENLIKLGEEQSKSIVNTLSQFGIDTKTNREFINKKKEDVSFIFNYGETDDGTDYEVTTDMALDLSELGVTHSYQINYQSITRISKTYQYDIIVSYPSDQEFNIADFPLLKKLIENHFDYDFIYDFDSFASVIESLESANSSGGELIGTKRNLGQYTEYIGYMDKSKLTPSVKVLHYILTLRKADDVK